MAETRLPFFTQTAVLDSYLKMTDLSKNEKTVEIIAKVLKEKSDLYTYFFRNRPHPVWANALLKYGYFKVAPDPAPSEDGFVLPPWPEQDYLGSIASSVPNVIAEHVRIIQGHNVYKNRAITALLQTPAETIESVLPNVMEWLDSAAEPYSLGFLHLGGLVKALANARRASAFSVFDAMSTPFPPLSNESGFHRGAISVFPFDDYSAGVSLSLIVEELYAYSPERTIAILEKQLRQAIDIEGKAHGYPDSRKSSFWRVAIEDSGQDGLDELKDKFLILLRNSLERSIKENPQTWRSTIKRYLVNDYEILRRLGLYLLTILPDEFTDLVKRELLSKSNMDDVNLHHEYLELLSAGYPFIGPNEQQKLVNSIVGGPSVRKLQQVSKRVEGESDDERENYIQGYSKFWIRDRLWMIKDHIEGDASETLNSLITDLGPPEHASFNRWTSGVYTVSQVSPTSVEKMRRKSIPDLVEFLKNWKPIQRVGPSEESFGALGGDVATLIFSDLQKYSGVALEIVSIHSAFATAIIYARSSKDVGDMDLLDLKLRIAQALLSEGEIRTSLEATPRGHWVGFRFALVGILKKLVSDFESDLSEAQLSKISSLLLTLCDDPDPDLESDRPAVDWIGHDDPLTVAINHVRPEAVLSFILFANRLQAKRRDSQPDQLRSFDTATAKIFGRKVARHSEPSLAVHSVFGLELERLYWLDKDWVIENIPEIFPESTDEEAIRFYIAAWDCWVANHRVPKELFELLRPQYERAIDNISNGYVTRVFNPIKGLANHVLLDYQLSEVAVSSAEGQESLIAKFFNKTLPDHRGEAAWALGARTHRHKEEWNRARQLWQWRSDVASSLNFSSDFEPEMEGYSNLLLAAPASETINTLWPLLQGFLHYLSDKKRWDRIWHNLEEFLAGQGGRNPREVIRYYSLMHDQLSQPRPHYETVSRTIIETGARNKISREETLMLIDKLNRRGTYDYRTIGDNILAGRYD